MLFIVSYAVIWTQIPYTFPIDQVDEAAKEDDRDSKDDAHDDADDCS